MQKFAKIVLDYLENVEGFVVDVSTRNPIERISHEVSSGRISPLDALTKVRTQSRLYRLSSSDYKRLESSVKKL